MAEGLIVFDNPQMHLWTRGAAFLASFYIVNRGRKHNDDLLQLIGYSTMVFDAYTFYLTVKILN